MTARDVVVVVEVLLVVVVCSGGTHIFVPLTVRQVQSVGQSAVVLQNIISGSSEVLVGRMMSSPEQERVTLMG